MVKLEEGRTLEDLQTKNIIDNKETSLTGKMFTINHKDVVPCPIEDRLQEVFCLPLQALER